jgi:hypothetical protein
LGASKKRVLRKYSIDLMHQVKRCGIKADCHAFNHLRFPRAHLRRVQLAHGSDLLHRLVTTQRLKRHGSLEII